jgi:hypothetical protein
MPYTVTKLINNAFYTSGIVAREFQTVSGTQVQEGLDYLNEILGDTRAADDMLSYFTRYTFNTVAGQEKYTIPGLIEVDSLTFTLDTIRYQMNETQRIEYFGTPRANQISSLPLMYHVERQLNGADLYMYFLPLQVYPMELWGLFGLTAITSLATDLLLTYDQFYINYLKYVLAQRICINYDYDISPKLRDQVKYYEGIISKQSQQMDLKMQKISTLVSGQALSYGQINLGKSWTVP